ncbi:hypothetical protein [Gottfriedia acidiceleris]|uniref:hypothetical protein n=1 Tax=Gottfriedia acidiceleris TaxID=371036 RepID=UPI0030009637
MNYYTIDSAVEILEKFEITHSKQVLNRWTRELRLKGEKIDNKYRISEEELYKFIELKKPKIREILDNTSALKEDLVLINERIILIDEKIALASSEHVFHPDKVDKIESELNNIQVRLSSFEESINEIKQLLNDINENGLKRNVEQKKVATKKAKINDGSIQMDMFNTEENDLNSTSTLTPIFEEKQLLQALQSELTDDIYDQYGSKIFNRIKSLLIEKKDEWDEPLGKKRFKCLFTKQRYEKIIPFLKNTVQHVSKEIINK